MKYTIVTLSALVATTSAQQFPCKGNWVPANEIVSGTSCGEYDEKMGGAITESQFETACAASGSDAVNAGNNYYKTCCESEDVYLCPANAGDGDTDNAGDDDDDSDGPCQGGEGEKMPGMCATTVNNLLECNMVNDYVKTTCLLTEVGALCDGFAKSSAEEQAFSIACCADGKIICSDQKFMEKHAPGSASGTLSLAFGALAAVGLSYVCNML